ncbi:hypothetical protein BT96DRAFT_923866 [Gymnopus androsaceus JB14]|uniref:Uncharacterized protein n=1 Tax=Gymnopus androsaceus JB14 TaxID=1447944 RepID=A0A6A4H8Y8_9AGAR|nr:hypothetical protein BT96DRAFT_923866 [Gymnopus androsaceus JB14]
MQLLHLLPTLTYLDYKPDSREGEYTLKPLLECLTPPLLRTIFNHATREAFPNIILDDGGDEHYRHELLLPNLKELVLTLWVETVPLLVDFLRLRKSSGAPQKLQVHPHIRQRWNQARLSNKMRLSTAFQEFQGDDSLEVFVHTA